MSHSFSVCCLSKRFVLKKRCCLVHHVFMLAKSIKSYASNLDDDKGWKKNVRFDKLLFLFCKAQLINFPDFCIIAPMLDQVSHQ